MTSIDEYLELARSRLRRITPETLDAEIDSGALLVDIRPQADRERFGEMPGAMVIERNVLEWRLAPSSDARIVDLDHDRLVILFCNDGYQSSLSAVVLRDLDVNATDLIGGYNAYSALRRARDDSDR
jgi:rhodanese-related sulfurtransferase